MANETPRVARHSSKSELGNLEGWLACLVVVMAIVRFLRELSGDVIGSNAPRQLSPTGDFTQNPLAGLGNYFPPANFFWRIVRNSFCWSSVIARSGIGKNEIGDGTGQRRDPPLPSL